MATLADRRRAIREEKSRRAIELAAKGYTRRDIAAMVHIQGSVLHELLGPANRGRKDDTPMRFVIERKKGATK